ncbi:MAG: DUF3027 domain-containing protein [Micropruina sp.]
MRASETLDRACVEAVELAHAAAVSRAGAMGVGEHLGVVPCDTRVVTHLFACPHPGYPGWTWQVTVVRASRARVVTVNEVTLMPGDGALLAPAWLPWSERIGPGDLAPGVIMPTPDNDPRVEPGFTAADMPPDMEPAEWSATRALVAELGLGRERVLSPLGRDQAAERWLAGDGGPDNPMTTQATGVCETCAYFVTLSGALGQVFGACTNEYTPSDGRVVSRDHGCGAHSDTTDVTRSEQLPVPAWDTLSVDRAIF